MLNEKLASLINNQIQKEFYSSYLYLGMSNYYNDVGLDGFANWFYVQVQEELDHAMLFRTYMNNNNKPVTLQSIEAVSSKYADYLAPLNEALKHEEYVTGLINTIYQAANEEHDYRTTEFLNWFIKEQGEEEKNTSDLITKFNLYGNDAKGLYQLNQELMTRVYTAPSLVL
ncbi:MAG: ferritin [Suipraeoptans sp.]